MGTVRTTLNLPDQLVDAVRERAAREGRTFTSLVEEGLRAAVDRPTTEPAVESVPLPTFGAPDGVFRVDVLDKDALWAVLDGDPGRDDPPQ